jgi:hypothetical protein
MPARPADKRLQNEGYMFLAIQALQKMKIYQSQGLRRKK